MVGRRGGARLRSVVGLAVALLAVSTACGADTTAGGAPGTAPPGTTEPAAGDLVAWCDDIEPPGPIADSDAWSANPDPTLMGVLNRYAADHADTFGGLWIDRVHGGTIVLAFTDAPAAHREAIGGLVAQPGDPTGVATAPATVAPGVTETAPPTTPPSTTVADSGAVVDVVQVARSEADLQQVQDQVMGAFADGALPIASVGTNPMTNRVSIGLGAEADDDARRLVAERLPADAVCLEGGPAAAPYYDLPATLIPAAGSDPWVTCQHGGMPIRLSALEHPPALAPDDPLQVAFERQAGIAQPGVPVDPAAWHLLAVEGDHALFAASEPYQGFVTMDRQQGRWIWSGSSSGTCEPEALLPEGQATVEWTLDAAYPPPAPGDTVLHVLVNRLDCSSGTPVGEDLIGPEVEARDGQVLVAFAAEALPPGGYNCVGSMPQPAEVTLAEPLPAGPIVDGRSLPPRPVERTGGGIVGG